MSRCAAVWYRFLLGGQRIATHGTIEGKPLSAGRVRLLVHTIELSGGAREVVLETRFTALLAASSQSFKLSEAGVAQLLVLLGEAKCAAFSSPGVGEAPAGGNKPAQQASR